MAGLPAAAEWRKREAMTHFHYSRVQPAVLTIVLLLLLAAAGYVLMRMDWANVGALALLVIMLALLLGYLAATIARLFWRGPVLSVGPEGILDRRIGPAPIPWGRVQEVYAYAYRRAPYLAVVVDDPEAFADPPGIIQRFILWANTASRLPEFSLSLAHLNTSQKTILTEVGKHIPDGVSVEAPQKRRWL